MFHKNRAEPNKNRIITILDTIWCLYDRAYIKQSLYVGEDNLLFPSEPFLQSFSWHLFGICQSHSIDDGSSLSRKEGVEYTNFSTGDLDDLSIKAVNWSQNDGHFVESEGKSGAIWHQPVLWWIVNTSSCWHHFFLAVATRQPWKPSTVLSVAPENPHYCWWVNLNFLNQLTQSGQTERFLAMSIVFQIMKFHIWHLLNSSLQKWVE